MNKEGWEIKKLGEVCDCFIGMTYKPENVSDKGVIVLRSGNIQEDKIDLKDLVRIDKTIPSKHFVKDNDILMCSRNGSHRLVGKCSLVHGLYENMTFGAFMTIIRSEFNNYLIHFFRSPYFRNQLTSSKTSTINQITVSMLRDISIPVPPLPVQEQIVAELDALNDILTKKRQQLAELDTLAQATFYEMFDTQNEKWENTTIENVCVLKSGKSLSDELLFKEGIYPYVKVSDMNNINNMKYITCSSNYCTHKKEADIIPKGSIIFPKRGGAIATNKKRITAIDIYADLNTMAVIPSVKVNKHFIYQYFINLDLGKLSNGAAIPQINNGDINPLPVLLPPLPLQNQFAEQIEAIEKQKELINQSIAEVQNLFDYTMDKYFN